MNFEHELAGRLRDTAGDFSIGSGDLSQVRERAQARRRRRLATTRVGGVAALVVVAGLGVVILTRADPAQTIDTADGGGSASAADDPSPGGASGGGAEPRSSVAESDSGDDAAAADDDERVSAAGPGSPFDAELLPLVFAPSKATGWQLLLAPGLADAAEAAAVEPHFEFGGGAALARMDDTWYVDRGAGWQRLLVPPDTSAVAVDLHDRDRVVVAGWVDAGPCEHYMTVVVLGDGSAAPRRVPTGLPAGVRAVPVAAEIRATDDATVLSTVEQVVADPLCLLAELGIDAGTAAVTAGGGIEYTDAAGTTRTLTSADVAALLPASPHLQAALAGEVTRRVSLAVSQDSPRTPGRPDAADAASKWHLTLLRSEPWDADQTAAVPAMAVPAALGVVETGVVAAYRGEVVLDLRPGAESAGAESSRLADTVEPSRTGGRDFFAVRDGSVARAGAGTAERAIDVVETDRGRVAVTASDDGTTVSAGNRTWTLREVCGADSGWARLGEVGGAVRLITSVDGRHAMYQLTEPA
ncbi:MAG TPA: hypothetical protein DEP66_00710 [Acidimicrobiaceae bacterium]|nr:hypothetical protein [Acidimicrobiaceae bacterium]